MTRRILLLALAICALAPTAAWAAPTVSIDDVSHLEGNGAASSATFTVRLSEAAPAGGVAIAYATQDATARAPADYAAASGAVTIPAGATSAPIDVSVSGDVLSEANETFAVNLSGPTNGATLADAQGVGTIVNDDAPPAVRVNDVRVAEGDSGVRAATFTVSLSQASGQDVTIAYASSNGSARAPGDYAPATGAVVIPAGLTSAGVGVRVQGDTTDEYDETFNLNLVAASGAAVADGRGVGTVIDDDGAPSLSVRDVRVREGNRGITPARFVVALSRPSGKPVSVHFATRNGSAQAGSDYAARSGTLSMAPGAMARTVDVGVTGDTRHEADESFALTLSRARNASIRDGTGTAAVQDDDAANRAPRVTRYRLAPKVFRAARRGGSLAARSIGARVSYRLSEPARVAFRVQRLRHGRPYTLLRGSFSRAGRLGRNVVRFTGRLRHHRLAPGRYRLVIVAVDPQGLRSRPRAVAFRISG
ncbi:MAG: hypothetical protein M3Z33_01045 [Actinomycetota bacterium]|nr:hypothetical protein [Actinomycetota bacterium]